MDEQDPRVVLDLAEHNVLSELRLHNHARTLGLSEQAMQDLATSIVAELDYAFELRWAPDWVRPGAPHTWHDTDGWHARCNRCLAESPAARKIEEAMDWFTNHQPQHG